MRLFEACGLDLFACRFARSEIGAKALLSLSKNRSHCGSYQQGALRKTAPCIYHEVPGHDHKVSVNPFIRGQ